MNAKTALGLALLQGKVLNIKNGFQQFGITNIPREISRLIEKPFGLRVSRTRKEGTTRYGQTVFWIDYRLNRTGYNKEGIDKLKAYIQKQSASELPPKTDKEAKEQRIRTQTTMF